MYYEVLSLVLEKEKKILCLLCNKRRTKKKSEHRNRRSWGMNFLMNEWNCSAVSSGKNTR